MLLIVLDSDDLFFVVYRYDFIRLGLNGIVGLVWVLRMCINFSVIIVEDYFNFDIIIVVVYEFGYRFLKIYVY